MSHTPLQNNYTTLNSLISTTQDVSRKICNDWNLKMVKLLWLVSIGNVYRITIPWFFSIPFSKIFTCYITTLFCGPLTPNFHHASEFPQPVDSLMMTNNIKEAILPISISIIPHDLTHSLSTILLGQLQASSDMLTPILPATLEEVCLSVYIFQRP